MVDTRDDREDEVDDEEMVVDEENWKFWHGSELKIWSIFVSKQEMALVLALLASTRAQVFRRSTDTERILLQAPVELLCITAVVVVVTFGEVKMDEGSSLVNINLEVSELEEPKWQKESSMDR